MRYLGLSILLFHSFSPASYAQGEQNYAIKNPDLATIHAVSAPETEIALAQTTLNNLHKKIDSSAKITSRHGLGPQTINAEEAYENAILFYKHKEYLSVVRELNVYLNLTQVPKMKAYLYSQFLLGHSYEEIGFKSKALKAYFRYLAAFLTSTDNDYDEMLHVMRRMLPLAALDSGNEDNQLEKLLSSITSLDLPQNIQPSVFYYAAKSAANAGHNNLAESWLKRAVLGDNKPGLKARAIYINAIIALSVKDFDTAEKLMIKIVNIDDSKDIANKNLARLALARIAIHRKKPKQALYYYDSVPEDTDGYRDALFESIYIHLSLNQDSVAKSKAQTFIKKHTNHGDAFKLKTLLAYLDLRAGNLSAANQNIDANNGELQNIQTWMRNTLTGKDHLSHSELTNFLNVSEGQVQPTETVKEAFALFQRLAEVSRRLADSRGELKDINYTIGRAQLNHLNPFWINRAEQLANLGEELLKVGHRLSAAERHLYADQLSKLDKYKLVNSEERRIKLLSTTAHSKRRLQNWKSYATFLNLTKEISDSNKKIAKAKATLASAKYMLETAGQSQIRAKKNDVAHLESRISELNNHLSRTLELLRSKKTQDLINQSPHRYVRKFIAQYALALDQESEILANARTNPVTTSQKLLADDATKAWKHWQFLTKKTFEQLASLDQKIKSSLTGMLAELTELDDTYLGLYSQTRAITGALEHQVGSSLAFIVGQYSQQIDRRLSQNRKWKADVEWLKYTKSVSQKQKMTSKYDLEQQILNDNLSDMEQGALWQWPR